MILDDWGLKKLTGEQQYELLELIEERYGRTAMIITSQFPVEHWHEQTMADPTLADSLIDRVVFNAYRIELSGESMRRVYNSLPHAEPPH